MSTAGGPPVPAARALRLFLLGLPSLILLAWLAAITWHASLMIDQVRYFYLDDVQMISMRYARHLAEGQGLVWNPGERVEGYSNPGWVLVMAAIHFAAASPATTALWVKFVGAVAALAVLRGALQLARVVGPLSVGGEFVLFLALAMSADLVFWAANGFETTLLTALFVSLLARASRDALEGGAARPGTMVAAGLLPFVRSDAHLLTLAIIAVSVGLSVDRRKSLLVGLMAFAIPLIHEAGRLMYYGDAFPNTFVLRYHDAGGVWRDGARHVRALVYNYGAVIALAVASPLPRNQSVRMWMLVPLLCAGTHAFVSGGDMYEHFRFFAPAVPVLLVLAIAGVESWTRTSVRIRTAALAAVLAVAIAGGGMVRASPIDALRSWRGKPWQGTVIGLLIDRETAQHATVAAVDVGALGYFSRRKIIDLTGRTDAEIARSRGRPGADPAWRKFDINRSLATRPDLVATSAPHEAAQLGEAMFALHGVDTSTQVIPALVSNPTFLRSYRDYPVPLAALLERSALYVRSDSPERPHIERWRMPEAR